MTVTFVPGLTVSVVGENAKFLIEIVFAGTAGPCAAPVEDDDAPGPDVLELHAATPTTATTVKAIKRIKLIMRSGALSIRPTPFRQPSYDSERSPP
ncbi:MAG TPA: hypothetical protein VGH43_05265 [Jatrophihabitans sp.]